MKGRNVAAYWPITALRPYNDIRPDTDDTIRMVSVWVCLDRYI